MEHVPLRFENAFGDLASFKDELEVRLEVAEAEFGNSALFLAEEFPRSAELEIGFGDFETVRGLFEDFEAL